MVHNWVQSKKWTIMQHFVRNYKAIICILTQFQLIDKIIITQAVKTCFSEAPANINFDLFRLIKRRRSFTRLHLFVLACHQGNFFWDSQRPWNIEPKSLCGNRNFVFCVQGTRNCDSILDKDFIDRIWTHIVFIRSRFNWAYF